MLKKHVVISALCVVALSLLAAGCTTNPYTGEREVSKAAIGAGVGAAGGAAVGAVVGGGDWRKRALIGAGVGALAGGAVGGYMDYQEAKLRQKLQGTGVSVTRNGDQIILNMPGNVTFDTDSSTVKPQFMNVLDSVAEVLEEYNKTYVDVMGHTDSTGSASYNLQLSQARAQAVANVLRAEGVMGERLLIKGYGENQPIASNSTAQGRAQNRRVEIQITPVT